MRTKRFRPMEGDRHGGGFWEMGKGSNSTMKRGEERADEVARKDSGEERREGTREQNRGSAKRGCDGLCIFHGCHLS